MTGLLVILLVLAVYRTTRFITRDKFPLMDIPRESFVQRWGVYEGVTRDVPDDKRNFLVRAFLYLFGMQWQAIGGKRTNLIMKSLAYLWECDWCTSIWIGGVIVYASTQFINVPYPFLFWLASSAATGLLTNIEEKLDK